jgi:hypothetical protein
MLAVDVSIQFLHNAKVKSVYTKKSSFVKTVAEFWWMAI